MGAGTSNIQDLTIDQVLYMIGEYFLSRRMTLQDAFLFLDTDNSGAISADELLRGIRICVEDMGGNGIITKANLLPIFQRFDANGDGQLSIQEFAQAFGPSSKLTDAYYDNYSRNASFGQNAYGNTVSYVTGNEQRRAQDVITRIATSMQRMGYTPQALFAKIDADQNGWVSRDELEQTVRRFQPDLSLTEQELIFNIFDRNGNGRIELVEFLNQFDGVSTKAFAAVEDLIRQVRSKFSQHGRTMAESFQVFDRNMDGLLSREEWRRAMTLLGPEIPPSDVDAVFQYFDVNKDGFMSIAEFTTFFTNSIDRMPSMSVSTDYWAPQYAELPVEAYWEKEFLDLIRSCFKERSGGMTIGEVFRRLNLSGTNQLSLPEFQRMVLTYQPDLTAAQVESLFYKVNISRTGSINLGEFVRRFG